ncbi:hypothetical protein [Peribacillus asahii]|uniref:Uncharacterized protein n=1 Tax=Peribacillus asahii TaxID=228899 RepID=A0A3Q9RQL5_9BACI|nr:hypothetical protein [Peribacillus asahii]AZV44945.1 hypothetical protein BAOM_4365 [Peribacillus asahii]USK84573.1 hypothetical protein LIT35_19605 [Peribacillus asahii]
MEHTAKNIKDQMTFELLIQILKEHGITTDKEIQDRLTNQVKLSSMDEELKQRVIEQIKH